MEYEIHEDGLDLLVTMFLDATIGELRRRQFKQFCEMISYPPSPSKMNEELSTTNWNDIYTYPIESNENAIFNNDDPSSRHITYTSTSCMDIDYYYFDNAFPPEARINDVDDQTTRDYCRRFTKFEKNCADASFALKTRTSIHGSAESNDNAYVDEMERTVFTLDAAVKPVVVEKYELRAKDSRVLNIVVNSLYQNKDVFLGELSLNASCASYNPSNSDAASTSTTVISRTVIDSSLTFGCENKVLLLYIVLLLYYEMTLG